MAEELAAIEVPLALQLREMARQWMDTGKQLSRPQARIMPRNSASPQVDLLRITSSSGNTDGYPCVQRIENADGTWSEPYLPARAVHALGTALTSGDIYLGRVVRVATTGELVYVVGSGPLSPDIYFRVSNTDTTSDYGINKLVAGANITITKLNAGGAEQLQIAATGAAAAGSQQAKASVDLTVTNAAQDVASATLTLTTGTWIVSGVFDVTRNGVTNDRVFEGVLNVAASAQTFYSIFSMPNPAAGERATVTQLWRITIAGASAVVKLQALFTGGTAGDFTVTAANTLITAWQAGTSTNILLDGTNHTDTTNNPVFLGDMIAGNSTPKWDRVPGQVSTTLNVLTQTGTGAVSAVPVWQPLSLTGTTFWVKITKTYVDFSDPTSTKTITIYTVPIKGLIHAAVVHHTIAFSNPNCYVQANSPTSVLLGLFNVSQAPGNTVFETVGSTGFPQLYNFGATANVTSTLDGAGTPLNTLNAGSMDFYLFISVLP